MLHRNGPQKSKIIFLNLQEDVMGIIVPSLSRYYILLADIFQKFVFWFWPSHLHSLYML